MYRCWSLFFLAVLGTFSCLPAAAEPGGLAHDAKQLVVCIAPELSSFEGTLQRYQRDTAGKWQKVGKPWPVLFGRKGLAWGRGLHPAQPGPQKQTGDLKTPMGLFKLGLALGDAAQPPPGKGWPYHQVTDRTAWIDDEKLAPLPYNHLYTLPPGEPYPVWWEKEKMHLGDVGYQWLVLIEHNYDNPDPGAGNGIFLHVRRGVHYRTAGCTTMQKENLESLIAWLDPTANPMIVELTKADYARFWKPWNLPPPGKD